MIRRPLSSLKLKQADIEEIDININQKKPAQIEPSTGLATDSPAIVTDPPADADTP